MAKTVLVVDDQPEYRVVISKTLEQRNFKIFEANDGLEGLQAVKDLEPDLIICDIFMPNMDGLQMLEELAKDPDTSEIPFIFLTADDKDDSMKKAARLGVSNYLVKPFTPTELLDSIDMLVPGLH